MIKVSVLIPVWNQEKLVIRALDSFPRRDDIEIFVCDDASTDNTLAVLRKYKKDNPDLNLVVLHNKENKGFAGTFNKLIDKVSGEYFTCLGSDDYLYTEEWERVIEQLDGTDIVCFDCRKNDGTVFNVTDESKVVLCGQGLRFYRTAKLGDIKMNAQMRAGADYPYNLACIERGATHKFTGIVAAHYNFPREGSLSYLIRTGVIK